MYSDSDLEAAVAAGALSPDAAAQLRAYMASRSASSPVDEEHFRLITGFNDIFVSIAAAILLFAVAWIGSTIGPRIGGDGPSPVGAAFVAATAWGLAEFFTRKRRMALPSILLLLAFVGVRIGICGRTQQRQSQHVVLTVVAIFTVVQDAHPILRIRQVRPAKSRDLETRFLKGVPAAGRPTDRTIRNLIRRVFIPDRQRERGFHQDVLLVPVHIVHDLHLIDSGIDSDVLDKR